MRRLLYTILFLIPMCLLAQRQNDVWFFGAGAGMSFASGTPTPILGPLFTQEGTSTVCDSITGALLFTTDGVRVLDRNLAVMPNGVGLEGGWSSTQSALILPKPGDLNKYYVFTAGDLSNGDARINPGLRYSIVDMELNGGLGEVTAVKNYVLIKDCAEKLSATRHCDGESWWVVAHDRLLPRFYMYKVTPRGIENAVISNVGTQFTNPDVRRLPGGNYGLGMAKFSASGRLLAIANPHSRMCELYSVDLRTGRISNPRFVDSARAFYGLSFSPSEELLYVTTFSDVLQYNLRSSDISTSRHQVGTFRSHSDTSLCGGIQRGPDGVIYMADSTGLRRIPFPDLLGDACGYNTAFTFMLRAPTIVLIGLPNVVDGQYASLPSPDCPRADFQCDTVVCVGSALNFVNYSSNNSTSWEWLIPDAVPSKFVGRTPPPVTFSKAGLSQVSLVAMNSNGSDTMSVQVRVAPLPTISAGADVTFCTNEQQRLTASGGVRYEWSPASALSNANVADPIITTTQKTTFVLKGWNADGCESSDTVDGVFLQPAPLILHNLQCQVSQSVNLVVEHPLGEFDSCDVVLLFPSKCLSGVTVTVGEERSRLLMTDGRTALRMRLRKRVTDNIVAVVQGTVLLQTYPYVDLECVVESSYGCREVSGAAAAMQISGCALNLRSIKLEPNMLLHRTIYSMDGSIVQSDDIRYDSWEEQPSMPSAAPAGLFVEVLALPGTVVKQRTFVRVAH